MDEGRSRTRAARQAAERALLRVVHHYGGTPEFVVLGGLVPELLCAASRWRHAGTTDVDVQVDLEVALGSVNMVRLEDALRKAEFAPDGERAWRWATGDDQRSLVQFELLADLAEQPAGATVSFDACRHLAAVNLRGSGFAARDAESRHLSGGTAASHVRVEIKFAGLAGFLLAKLAAACSRQKPKDWYDIAYVLLHNDAGGPDEAAARVISRFADELGASNYRDLRELRAISTTATPRVRAHTPRR